MITELRTDFVNNIAIACLNIKIRLSVLCLKLHSNSFKHVFSVVIFCVFVKRDTVNIFSQYFLNLCAVNSTVLVKSVMNSQKEIFMETTGVFL